jgi:type I restriction enzyme, S subunit
MESVSVIGEYDVSKVSPRSCFPSSITEFRKGDVLMAKITPCFENGKGAFLGLLPTSKGIGSTEFHVFRVFKNKLKPKFLYYVIHNKAFRDYAQIFMEGTAGQKRITTPFISNIKIPIPLIEEQQRIVEFLDRKTAEIDQAIAQKQRLIELLKEQKAILIDRVVTKGLDPNAPMQDSRITWIGETPVHWKACALSYVSYLTAGGTPDRSKAHYWNGNIPWLKTGEVNYNTIMMAEEFITPHGLLNSSTKLAPPGTILMAMYGQGVTRGRVAILGIEAAFNQACLAITPCSQLQTKYLYYYLQNAYISVRDTGNETSQMNLSSGVIGKIKVLIPPHEEQKSICHLLDQKMTEFDNSISKQAEIIKSLSLLKQIFVSQAVTGKIKI